MKYLSTSVAETDKIASDFLRQIQGIKVQAKGATVVGLFGDLGSGKTTFTQALGKHLNVSEIMTSPTFVIQKRYDLDDESGFRRLVHVDAYRLESGQEILNLNFQEDLNDINNLILIEWPERIIEALPEDILKINFKFMSENEREIEF